MKRLILVGGGHAHVEVVRRLALSPLPHVRVVLVSAEPESLYSGMLPGYVAGHYTFSDCRIALEPLCRAANVEFRLGRVAHIDPFARSVGLHDGTLEYDVLSLNIGAAPETEAIPGALEHGAPVKPLAAFVRAWTAIDAQAIRVGGPLTIAVVGAGAGGIELALAMHHRLTRKHGKPISFHLLTDAATILVDHPPSVRRKLASVLRQRGVEVHTMSPVTALTDRMLYRAGGAPLAVDHVFIAISATAPRWLGATGLKTDARGFVVVNSALQSVSHPDIFAAGDVASIEGCELTKSGVHAVREGPVLAENLRRALTSRALLCYSPPSSVLALISTGNRSAVMSWRGFALGGRWVWRWKDHIDRRFVARYRPPLG